MPLPVFLPWVEDARWLLGDAASFTQSKNSHAMPVEVVQPLFEEEREEVIRAIEILSS